MGDFADSGTKKLSQLERVNEAVERKLAGTDAEINGFRIAISRDRGMYAFKIFDKGGQLMEEDDAFYTRDQALAEAKRWCHRARN